MIASAGREAISLLFFTLRVGRDSRPVMARRRTPTDEILLFGRAPLTGTVGCLLQREQKDKQQSPSGSVFAAFRGLIKQKKNPVAHMEPRGRCYIGHLPGCSPDHFLL